MINTAFENENFVVFEKPSGVLSIPARQNDGRPVLSQLVKHDKLGEYGDLLIVHRLDYEVSGLLMFAKNADAHRVANGWFENRQIEKTYEAWTEKLNEINDPIVGTMHSWQSTLLRGKKRAYESLHGKASLTEATYSGKVKYQDQFFLQWSVLPRTGRSHQIRYEMFKHGYPIVGDKLYGAQLSLLPKTVIALRAVCLNFSMCPLSDQMGLPRLIKTSDLSHAFKSI